jgi:hypothetical protein
MTFGDDDISGSPEDLLKFEISRNCFKMAENINDNVLLSMINPGAQLEDSPKMWFGKDLFNKVVKVMDPYYIHPNIDYLEHFKKCVYVANTGDGPTFFEKDSEDGEEKDCWLHIYRNDQGDIEYNSSKIPKISQSENYKKDIKEALTNNCVKINNEKIAFLPQIARQEYNESLEQIRKYNEEKRIKAEAEVVAETPNPDIQAQTGQIDGSVETPSTQTTQMAESYQNSMQDFLTPTGDIWLDAGKLFLSTLLEGYFEELKKGLFKLPENLTFNDFENFGDEFVGQFDDGSDWFGEDNWEESLLQDLVGVPKSGSIVGQSCIMNTNCESGLCDYNAESDKICMECNDEEYICPSPKVCYNNKCVECAVNADCNDTSKVCTDNKCVECAVNADCNDTSKVCTDNKCVITP